MSQPATAEQVAIAPADSIATAPLTDLQRDYLLREFEHLKNEIEAEVQESRTLERYAILATGGTWGWLATHQLPKSAHAAWWIPVLFVGAAALRCLAMAQFILRAASYLRIIEGRLLRNEGWESYLVRIGRGAMPWTTILTWLGLILAVVFGPRLIL